MRVLGFPVTVHPGFVGFMALLAVLNARDPRFGAVLAGSFAVFTLVHELGHALAARRFGANAAIFNRSHEKGLRFFQATAR